MIIGIPREIKKEEYRVGLTPQAAAGLKKDGHAILVESGAGLGSGFSDDEYLLADADIVDRGTVFSRADLIVKVKEPVREEYDCLGHRQALFCFLHLAPNPELTGILLEKNISAFAFETLSDGTGLPLLSPMSEIAGRMAPLMAAYYLQRPAGGRGVFPPGIAGVDPAKCVILGAGVAGTSAARMAYAIGMETLVLNVGMDRLRKIDGMFSGRVRTMLLNDITLRDAITGADAVICCILVPGGRTPILITRQMLGTMKKGAVIVDISVDQGGAVETTRPTTHAEPVYSVDGIIHYAVSNMPGAYPRTATLALSNATLPYIKALAADGAEGAVEKNQALRTALNVYRGKVVNRALAEALGVKAFDIETLASAKPVS
ncbi:MAG: alanine dehydrogenase [Nitrospiraceae bacterium]|nr:alanine dehydrogenase [Nitrospiraceae bacterium]